MYSIGEFSKISGITIKALRLYHEKELLVPRIVDERSGYRYYDRRNLEQARGIVYLKQMLIPLEDIKSILSSFQDEVDLLDFFCNHRSVISAKIKELQTIASSLEDVIHRETEAKMLLKKNEFEILTIQKVSPWISGGGAC